CISRSPNSTLFPYTTLFRSYFLGRHRGRTSICHGLSEERLLQRAQRECCDKHHAGSGDPNGQWIRFPRANQDHDFGSEPAESRKDRKSTRLNSSHEWISYAV